MTSIYIDNKKELEVKRVTWLLSLRDLENQETQSTQRIGKYHRNFLGSLGCDVGDFKITASHCGFHDVPRTLNTVFQSNNDDHTILYEVDNINCSI